MTLTTLCTQKGDDMTEKFVKLTFRLTGNRPFGRADCDKLIATAEALRIEALQAEWLDGVLLEKHERLETRGKSPLGDELYDTDFRPEPGKIYLFTTPCEDDQIRANPQLAARLANIQYQAKSIRSAQSGLGERISLCRRTAGLLE